MCLAGVAVGKVLGHGLGVLWGIPWEFFVGFCGYLTGVFPYI
jgi:hypothetical protein